MRATLRIGLFALVGPPVGLIVFTIYVGTATLVRAGNFGDFALFELLVPSNYALAYFLGGVPAILAGIASALLARRFAGMRLWALTAAAGAIAGVVGAWWTGSRPPDIGLATLFIACGGVAGLACAMLFDGLAALIERPR